MLLLITFAVSCAKKSTGITVLTTQTNTTSTDKSKNSNQPPEELKLRIISDGRIAASLLLNTACEDNTDIGVFSAIYARRAGLVPELSCEQSALDRGVQSKSILVKALSWSRLAQNKDLKIPPEYSFTEDDKAVKVLAALALIRRGMSLTNDLNEALMLPPNKPQTVTVKTGKDRDVIALEISVYPMDEGLAALTVQFCESVYEESAENDKDRLVWSAEKIRKKMFQILRIDTADTIFDEHSSSRSTETRHFSTLRQSVDNPLAFDSPESLINIALNAQDDLRIQALRAIAARKEQARTEYLATAAHALNAENLHVKIEGARTFLMLIRQ